MANKKVQKAFRKFEMIAALNDDIQQGGHIAAAARKRKKTLSDTWTKRDSRNIGGMFDAKAARAMKRAPVTVGRA